MVLLRASKHEASSQAFVPCEFNHNGDKAAGEHSYKLRLRFLIGLVDLLILFTWHLLSRHVTQPSGHANLPVSTGFHPISSDLWYSRPFDQVNRAAEGLVFISNHSHEEAKAYTQHKMHTCNQAIVNLTQRMQYLTHELMRTVSEHHQVTFSFVVDLDQMLDECSFNVTKSRSSTDFSTKSSTTTERTCYENIKNLIEKHLASASPTEKANEVSDHYFNFLEPAVMGVLYEPRPCGLYDNFKPWFPFPKQEVVEIRDTLNQIKQRMDKAIRFLNTEVCRCDARLDPCSEYHTDTCYDLDKSKAWMYQVVTGQNAISWTRYVLAVSLGEHCLMARCSPSQRDPEEMRRSLEQAIPRDHS